VAQARESLESEQLVAEMDQHHAAEHEIEGPQVLGKRLVDVAVDPLHPGPEDLLGQPEPIPAPDIGEPGGTAPRRPVVLALVLDVECDDSGAAALHLEGPEAVQVPTSRTRMPSMRSGSP